MRSDYRDDDRLWQRFQNGDTEALGQLMSRHYVALLHYGTRFTSDTNVIRDTMQDVFVELWNRRTTLSVLTTSQVKPYLMTMLRRLLYRDHQYQQRFRLTEPTDNRSESGVSSPEDRLIEIETGHYSLHRLQHLLNELPRRSREAIHLRFYEELDRPAIAQIMGISEQSVSNLFQDAFRFLRRHATAEEFWLLLVMAQFFFQ